ncbi:MAG TPA: DsbA family protein [Rhodoferax sp.]|jgi:2-hydroxychromene-2-carboxylate isomerase|nr:DsbA family protein [Rhodoferax sp.]HPW28667.1 DsbA family protein [Rhodoferax sp.]
MSFISAYLGRSVSRVITSTRVQSIQRVAHSIYRRGRAKAPTVHYFHEPDDSYSQLLVRCLPALQSRYAISIVSHLVPPPEADAAPDLNRLKAWSLRDTERLKSALPAWSLQEEHSDFALPASAPALAEGAALRRQLGHYQGGTLYFEGEWYWGVDRLHYLEDRLARAGLRVASRSESSEVPFIFPPRELQFQPIKARDSRRPIIHFYCSLRSPYTYLAARQIRALATHYGAELSLRYVLPMVMRGLPVPLPKRLYILRDTKREADRLGKAFGTVVDPVGKPVENGLALLHAAIRSGRGSALLESFLEGVFAQGIDASSSRGLNQIAERAGLSPMDIKTALGDQSWRAIAEDNRSDMLERGIWGVPSFRVNEKPLLWGQDRLWMLEEDLIAALHE